MNRWAMAHIDALTRYERCLAGRAGGPYDRRMLRIFVITALVSLGLTFAPTAGAARYKDCGKVTVERLIGRADVAAKNVSCRFARRFIRHYDAHPDMCDSRTLSLVGWKKRFGGEGEGTILTLINYERRIRTNACAS